MLHTLPARGLEDTVNVVVESPRGSSLKLKWEPSSGAFTLSRPLVTGLTYPYDWGFVPSTRAADGDPLDAMVLWDQSSFPGLLLRCRLIGALEVEQNDKLHPDRRERNDRLFVVPDAAPRANDVHDIDDVPERIKSELEQFFLASVAFQHKNLTILGWSNARQANRILDCALAST